MIIVTAPHSFADATPTPTPIAVTAMEQYRVAMGQYRTAMNAREQIRKEINKIFIADCRVANDLAKTAMSTAKTADAKSTILVQQKTAIALATSTRDAAIAAMGPAPTEPLKPVKLSEITPLKNGKSVKPTPRR
ncbi:unannotated protein [freshwater metagenome]|uniref:Unannotated protein n=1 Tax=freshwater metagenome TaxID=449393 RepID=A0A6J7TLD0_9ZZZZ